MAADTLGSYGSLARFPDLERIMKELHSFIYTLRISVIKTVSSSTSHKRTQSFHNDRILAFFFKVHSFINLF